jgi:hypothetical protein
VFFEPLDFIANVAALVSKPGVNMTPLDEELPCFLAFCKPVNNLVGMFWSTPTGHFPKGVFKFNWRLIQIG